MENNPQNERMKEIEIFGIPALFSGKPGPPRCGLPRYVPL